MWTKMELFPLNDNSGLTGQFADEKKLTVSQFADCLTHRQDEHCSISGLVNSAK